MDEILQITGVGNRLVVLDKSGNLWESTLDEEVGFLCFEKIATDSTWPLTQGQENHG